MPDLGFPGATPAQDIFLEVAEEEAHGIWSILKTKEIRVEAPYVSYVQAVFSAGMMYLSFMYMSFM